ncbi:hypothetical protein H4219_003006, partial [Mycoemilia scoparia]
IHTLSDQSRALDANIMSAVRRQQDRRQRERIANESTNDGEEGYTRRSQVTLNNRNDGSSSSSPPGGLDPGLRQMIERTTAQSAQNESIPLLSRYTESRNRISTGYGGNNQEYMPDLQGESYNNNDNNTQRNSSIANIGRDRWRRILVTMPENTTNTEYTSRTLQPRQRSSGTSQPAPTPRSSERSRVTPTTSFLTNHSFALESANPRGSEPRHRPRAGPEEFLRTSEPSGGISYDSIRNRAAMMRRYQDIRDRVRHEFPWDHENADSDDIGTDSNSQWSITVRNNDESESNSSSNNSTGNESDDMEEYVAANINAGISSEEVFMDMIMSGTSGDTTGPMRGTSTINPNPMGSRGTYVRGSDSSRLLPSDLQIPTSINPSLLSSDGIINLDRLQSYINRTATQRLEEKRSAISNSSSNEDVVKIVPMIHRPWRRPQPWTPNIFHTEFSGEESRATPFYSEQQTMKMSHHFSLLPFRFVSSDGGQKGPNGFECALKNNSKIYTSNKNRNVNIKLAFAPNHLDNKRHGNKDSASTSALQRSQHQRAFCVLEQISILSTNKIETPCTEAMIFVSNTNHSIDSLDIYDNFTFHDYEKLVCDIKKRGIGKDKKPLPDPLPVAYFWLSEEIGYSQTQTLKSGRGCAYVYIKLLRPCWNTEMDYELPYGRRGSAARSRRTNRPPENISLEYIEFKGHFGPRSFPTATLA